MIRSRSFLSTAATLGCVAALILSGCSVGGQNPGPATVREIPLSQTIRLPVQIVQDGRAARIRLRSA